MRSGERIVALAAIFALALASSSAAEQTRRPKKKSEPAAPAAVPGDRRDRVVAAPGTPFHGRAYWQATAQCGGIYFRLNTIYADAAITAKVIKPDPAAYTKFTKDAEDAATTATTFLDVSERFLVADRKVAREEAVQTYDPVASTAGDRLKSIDVALQSAKPCPDLYKTCRGAYPQVCNDSTALTN